MSFKSGRDKKSQFYVQFLGWMECRGLRGHQYTDPVIRELRRRQKKMDKPPKLTIQVSKKDLKISQDVDVDKKGKNIRKIKFPTIPARDVTYVHQSTRGSDGRLDDIVACIYLGYMPRTQRFVHVHVYRFDEATTAATFARQMASLVEANRDHIRQTELDLASRGEVDDPRLSSSDGMSEQHTTDSAMGSASSAYSDEGSPTFGSDDIDPDLQSLHEVTAFDNVADELKFRLQMGDKPLLLPPKDYDTISRAHGNLENINKRRCLNLNIVGESATTKDTGFRERNESSESGIDLASPLSELADENTVPEMNGGGSNPSPSQNRYSATSHGQQPQGFPDFPDGMPSANGVRSSHGSRSQSPDFVYPPKQQTRTSPDMSPQLYRAPRGPPLSRQSSQHSSHGSESDTQYYRAGPNNEIYAMPAKKGFSGSNKNSPREDVPPADYYDEEEEVVQMRGGAGPLYRQPHLTRSMPASLIRSEMALNGRGVPTPREHSGAALRHSAELRQIGLADPAVFVAGQHRANSPRGQRVLSARR